MRTQDHAVLQITCLQGVLLDLIFFLIIAVEITMILSVSMYPPNIELGLPAVNGHEHAHVSF